MGRSGTSDWGKTMVTRIGGGKFYCLGLGDGETPYKVPRKEDVALIVRLRHTYMSV